MSPKDDDDIRKLILERRARFLVAALSTTGLQACTPSGPSVCLSIQMTSSITDIPAGTSTLDGTNASHNSTTRPVDTCRNPPACVCLSIAVTQPPENSGTSAPPSSTAASVSTQTLDTIQNTGSSVVDGGVSIDGGGTPPADAGAEAGVDAAATNTGSPTTNGVSLDSSSEFTEPSVCLSILELKKK
jgi:hypothetical protein